MYTSMSDNLATTSATTSATTTRQIGIVKWFDNQKGFGMITTLQNGNKDIFAHHTEVNVTVKQYKYLVAGEYVSFDISQIVGDATKSTAVNIKGVLDGPVMCETLNTEKLLKNAYNAKRRKTVTASVHVTTSASDKPPPTNIKEKVEQKDFKEVVKRKRAPKK